MPPRGVCDRSSLSWRADAGSCPDQPTWDMDYHTYFRINVENRSTRVEFLGPESEEYGAPGWVRASVQHLIGAENEKAAQVEARAALRAALAQLKIGAHSSAAAAEVFPFATQKEGNAELRAQYDQKNGAGSAEALFEQRTGTTMLAGTTMLQQNVILSTLLGAPYAKKLRIQFDSQRGTGSADNLFAKLGIVAPAPKAALAPLPTVQPPNSQPSAATKPKSARARLANYFDNQLGKTARPGTQLDE